jgi:DNA invertase Pin-like site-specific DNA recombinase
MPIPGAILIRVSSKAQSKEDRYGIPSQLQACQDLARRHDVDVRDVFIDVISGTKDNRKELNRLLENVGKLKVVILYHTDRIARDEKLSYKILDELQGAGFQVLATNRGLVKKDLLFSVESAFAAEWLREHKKKIHNAYMRKADKGILPRSIGAYGYKEGKPDPELIPIVKRIFADLEHKGSNVLAQELNAEDIATPLVRGKHGKLWRQSGLFAIIANPVYKGEYHWGRSVRCLICDSLKFNHDPRKAVPVCCGQEMTLERVVIPCEGIVSPEQWERTHGAVKSRYVIRRRKTENIKQFPLMGVMRCALCGGAMSHQAMNDKWSRGVYFCYRRRWHKQFVVPRCEHKRYHHADELHHQVQRIVLSWLDDENALRKAANIPKKPESKMPSKRDELGRERERWKAMIKTGSLEPEEIARELRRINQQLLLLPPEKSKNLELDSLRQRLEASKKLSLSELVRSFNLLIFVHPDGTLDFNITG